MDDEERLISALNEIGGIAKDCKETVAEDCKREDETAERRKRLKDYFYNEAAAISMHIPKDSLYSDMKDEE